MLVEKIEHLNNSWAVGCICFFFEKKKSSLVNITENSNLCSLVAFVSNSRLTDVSMTLRQKREREGKGSKNLSGAQKCLCTNEK